MPRPKAKNPPFHGLMEAVVRGDNSILDDISRRIRAIGPKVQLDIDTRRDVVGILNLDEGTSAAAMAIQDTENVLSEYYLFVEYLEGGPSAANKREQIRRLRDALFSVGEAISRCDTGTLVDLQAAGLEHLGDELKLEDPSRGIFFRAIDVIISKPVFVACDKALKKLEKVSAKQSRRPPQEALYRTCASLRRNVFDRYYAAYEEVTDEECCEEDPDEEDRERELVFKDFLHTVLTDAGIPHPNPKKEAGNFNLMLAKAGIKTPDI